MSDPELTTTISLRVTPAQRDMIERHARRHESTVSEFIRDTVMSRIARASQRATIKPSRKVRQNA